MQARRLQPCQPQSGGFLTYREGNAVSQGGPGVASRVHACPLWLQKATTGSSANTNAGTRVKHGLEDSVAGLPRESCWPALGQSGRLKGMDASSQRAGPSTCLLCEETRGYRGASLHAIPRHLSIANGPGNLSQGPLSSSPEQQHAAGS